MSVKVSVSLSDEQRAFARDLVNQGRYPSLSAVVQSGIEMLREQTEADAIERDALRELLAKRRSGRVVSASEFFDATEAMIAAKRSALGP